MVVPKRIFSGLAEAAILLSPDFFFPQASCGETVRCSWCFPDGDKPRGALPSRASVSMNREPYTTRVREGAPCLTGVNKAGLAKKGHAT